MDEIADDIARDNPPRAVSYLSELEGKCRTAATTPDLFPVRYDLAPGLLMEGHGRHLVFFRDLLNENIARVERVLHGARNLPRLL